MEHSRGRKKSFKKRADNKGAQGERKFTPHKKTSSTSSKPKATTSPKNKKSDNTTRLNKYIAHAGICSRREADSFITAGVVKVNGEVVTELGYKVQPGDDVRFNDERLSSEKKVYILLNKPKDFATAIDGKGTDKNVLDLVAKACKERVYPVGNLDKKTTGVLLLTNDGDMTTRLTHRKYNRKKIFHVQLDKNFKGSDFETLMNGVELEDGPFTPDEMSFIDSSDKKQIGIEIHTGKSRIVQRIFEHVGYKVVRLDRVFFAGLTKKGLPRGKWRFLTEQEVNFLKMS